MIRFERITKQYQKRVVLDISSIAFGEGSRTAVLGANGSGKTTLLRILAGVLDNDGTPVNWNAGYLPQQPYAFGISVQKNVEAAVWRLPAKEREAAARNALRQVGMEHMADCKGNALSGGEGQRMALARLLAQKNSVLILDEPTAACDIAGIHQIEAVLKGYDGTVVFSTHSPAQAARLADRVVFLCQGDIAEEGETNRVLYSPQSGKMREFLKYWRF